MQSIYFLVSELFFIAEIKKLAADHFFIITDCHFYQIFFIVKPVNSKMDQTILCKLFFGIITIAVFIMKIIMN